MKKLIVILFVFVGIIGYSQKDSILTLKLTFTDIDGYTYKKRIKPFKKIELITNDNNHYKTDTLKIINDSLILIDNDTIAFGDIRKLNKGSYWRLLNIALGSGLIVTGTYTSLLGFMFFFYPPWGGGDSYTNDDYKKFRRDYRTVGAILGTFGLGQITAGVLLIKQKWYLNTETKWNIETEQYYIKKPKLR